MCPIPGTASGLAVVPAVPPGVLTERGPEEAGAENGGGGIGGPGLRTGSGGHGPGRGGGKIGLVKRFQFVDNCKEMFGL